ncbi:ACT domain-containing protein [Diplocloster modestus]|uniref:Amino acid-binding protein n=1 Tax=Diplocloster modestus TaxID=2850322 RepID=A0ABS6KAF5_9FIRM|nr:ACT domain-containing protein [Diplocloster modestus]MBU9727486.1 amino acid-binding protein [Diplocloster modestus]
MLKQLSVFVENRSGSLMNVTNALLDADINIRAISSFDTPEFGILRLIVDQPAEAKAALTARGFVVRVGDVLAVELEDKKGSLNAMLKILADGNISINYIYSFVIRENQAPVMVFHTDDIEEATQLLENHDLIIVD